MKKMTLRNLIGRSLLLACDGLEALCRGQDARGRTSPSPKNPLEKTPDLALENREFLTDQAFGDPYDHWRN